MGGAHVRFVRRHVAEPGIAGEIFAALGVGRRQGDFQAPGHVGARRRSLDGGGIGLEGLFLGLAQRSLGCLCFGGLHLGAFPQMAERFVLAVGKGVLGVAGDRLGKQGIEPGQPVLGRHGHEIDLGGAFRRSGLGGGFVVCGPVEQGQQRVKAT